MRKGLFVVLHYFISALVCTVLFAAIVIYADSHGATDAGIALIFTPFILGAATVLALILGLVVGSIQRKKNMYNKRDILYAVYAAPAIFIFFVILSKIF